jgi:glutathione S-transferase
MSITLYELPMSGNCNKVRILLQLLHLDYTSVTLDRSRDLELVPLLKVPALRVGGAIYTESMAIMFMLARGTPYLPEADLVEVIRWLSFEQSEIQMTIGVARYKLRHGIGSVDDDVAQARAALVVLDRHLAGTASGLAVSSYAHITIADIALYAYISLAAEVGIVLEPYGHLLGWLDRIREYIQR